MVRGWVSGVVTLAFLPSAKPMTRSRACKCIHLQGHTWGVRKRRQLVEEKNGSGVPRRAGPHLKGAASTLPCGKAHLLWLGLPVF